jgi:hypothetical protein
MVEVGNLMSLVSSAVMVLTVGVSFGRSAEHKHRMYLMSNARYPRFQGLEADSAGYSSDVIGP